MQKKYINNRPVSSNPDLPCPPEILKQQSSILVTYYGFDFRTHQGRIEVNQAVVEDVGAFFKLANSIQFPIRKVAPASDPAYQWNDYKLMSANVSSGFNYRLVAGANRISMHGQGLAFDINPLQNPYIRYKNGKVTVIPKGAIWDTNKPGSLSHDHPLVRFMLERGWGWGGDWVEKSGRTDYQHFQKPLTI
jgi:hypothetical protein